METKSFFHGRNQYRIDMKGRLPFPPQWFAPLDLRYGESIVAARGISPDAKFLELYSPKGWADKMAMVEEAFPEGKLKNNFIRWFVSTAESVELDTQNRIRIPKHLMEYAALDKDAILLGCVDRIEVWSIENLEKNEVLTEPDFGQIFGFLNEKRKKETE